MEQRSPRASGSGARDRDRNNPYGRRKPRPRELAAGHSRHGSGSSTPADDAGGDNQPRDLHQLVKALPFELFIEILSISLLDQSNVPKMMSLSKSINEHLATQTYATVTLSSAESIESFYELLRRKPEIGRKVKALWIGPTRMHSDLLAALAPPESVMCRSVNLREKVYTFTKYILRTCRKVEHLALSGGLCIPDAAFSYGTACQPKFLFCANPHSFVGAFSAPIFSKVVELHLVDTSLAIEDGDQISKMQSLRHFIWSSPKEDSDPVAEAARLHRMVLQSLNGELPPTMALPYAGSHNDVSFGLPLPANIADKLATRAKLLERITLQTSEGRCVSFRRSMQALPEMRVDFDDDGDSTDSGVFFSSSSSSSRDKSAGAGQQQQHAQARELARDKWIRVKAWALEPTTIDEWQALREEVCSASFKWGEVKARKKETDGEDAWLADGRKALQVFHQRWLKSL